MATTHPRGLNTFPAPSGPRLTDQPTKIVYPNPNRLHLTRQEHQS